MTLKIDKRFGHKKTGLKNIKRLYLSDKQISVRHRSWIALSLICQMTVLMTVIMGIIAMMDMKQGIRSWTNQELGMSVILTAAAIWIMIWSFNKGIDYLKVSETKEQTQKEVHEALKDLTLESQWATDWKSYASNHLKRDFYIMDLEMMKYLSTCERDMNWRKRVYGPDAKPHPLEEKQRRDLASFKKDPRSLLNLQKSIDRAIGKTKMSLWPR